MKKIFVVYQLSIINKKAFETDRAMQDAYSKVIFRPSQEAISNVLNGKADGLFYDKVASVKATDLEQVFELTNSIDQYWGDNDDVIEYGSQHRSTSVGDVVVTDGKFFYVDSFGFKELNS
jgi:hypothetical protein